MLCRWWIKKNACHCYLCYMIKRCLLLLLLLGLLLFLLFGFFLNLYVFPTIITLTYSNVTPLLVMDEFMDDYLHQLYYPYSYRVHVVIFAIQVVWDTFYPHLKWVNFHRCRIFKFKHLTQKYVLQIFGKLK